MSTKPPPSLSPFYTNHPASSAYRITMSPHEWTWTQEEQEQMAKAIVLRDAQIAKARKIVRDQLRVCIKNTTLADSAEAFLKEVEL